MPIFMDRHDAPPGTTAEEVKAAHQRDVESQDKYGVDFRTYWFDHQCSTIYLSYRCAGRGHRRALSS